jgi:hypothetical protein
MACKNGENYLHSHCLLMEGALISCTLQADYLTDAKIIVSNGIFPLAKV